MWIVPEQDGAVEDVNFAGSGGRMIALQFSEIGKMRNY